MMRLDIALLGPFQVTRDGEPVTNFETDPARALLIYLVMHAGTIFHREALADLLWPDCSHSEALHALRQTLNRLRRAIRDQEASPPFLHISRQTIQFNLDSDYWLDVDAFTHLVSGIHEHRHRRLEICHPCIQSLEQAASLYRGDWLSGFTLNSLAFEEWLSRERERLHRQAMESFYHLADYYRQCGDYQQAQHYARRQLELEPWREEAHCQLMAALALGGQRSAALAQYETCCRVLAQEFGVEPGRETRALYEQIRAGSLDRTEVPLHNLPAQLTRFVGRKAELNQIAEWLNDPGCRWLSLVGPGGIGKTRLALAAARQVVAHFPDGAWFVPLVDVHQGSVNELHERLAAAIAGAMGIAFVGQDSPKVQLFRILRSKQALLILDNFEHLAGGVDFIVELLECAPEMIVLITSRTRLNAQAECILPIRGLSVPPKDDDPAAATYSSVELFIERARFVLGNFAPDLTQVVQVCRLVQGLPLGIELASAWVEHMPLTEIVANMDSGLDFLSTTRRDVPARHQRLRAVLESSWRLLSEAEQRTLAQLAVFCGDFDRTAAMAVAKTGLAELVGLANKSLLQHSAPDRYALHALLRQFAAEKLESLPGLSGTRDRHSYFYLAFVSQRAAALEGSDPQPAMAEIQAELPNIRQAWQWIISQLGPSPLDSHTSLTTALAQCTEGLRHFYTFKGMIQEGESVFRTAAGHVQHIMQSQERESFPPECLAAFLQTLSRLLAAQGHFSAATGDYAAALTALREASLTLEEASVAWPGRDLVERAGLLVTLGHLYSRVGDYALAAQHLEAGLAMARHAPDPRIEITALNRLAQVACEQGAYDTAQGYLDEVLALARERDDRTSVASALSILGSIAWRWGKLEEAEKWCLESLVIYKELGNRHKISRVLNVLGILAILQEHYAQARQYYEEGLAMAKDIGDRQAMADTLNNLGYLEHHYAGNLQQARQYYQESLSIGREIGHRAGAASTLANLGQLCLSLGEHEAAWKCLREALSESAAIGALPLTLDALVGVARWQVENEQYVPAAELLGLILNNPALELDSSRVAKPILDSLRQALPASQLAAALERGSSFELDAVVAELLDRARRDR
jgi:DNA-binding SARP family transcriptional activator/predicted ATPase